MLPAAAALLSPLLLLLLLLLLLQIELGLLLLLLLLLLLRIGRAGLAAARAGAQLRQHGRGTAAAEAAGARARGIDDCLQLRARRDRSWCHRSLMQRGAQRVEAGPVAATAISYAGWQHGRIRRGPERNDVPRRPRAVSLVLAVCT